MEPLIQLSEVSVVRDGNLILDQLSISLYSGQHTAILGPNGCGKTTLLRLLAREIYPFAGQGEISWFGRSDWNQSELRCLIGIVQPIPHQALLRDFTAEEIILSGAFGAIGVTEFSPIGASHRLRCSELAESLQLGRLMRRKYATLSAGETQRVLIARALMPKPRILVLDEPTNGLDFVARMEFLHQLAELPDQVETVLLVTHHFEELSDLFGRVIVMRGGRIQFEGTRKHLTAETVASSFSCAESIAAAAMGSVPTSRSVNLT